MFRTHYALQDFQFALATDCPGLVPELGSLYPALLSEPGKCSTEWKVQHNRSRKAGTPLYVLYEDEQAVYETRDRIELLEHLEWTVLLKILENLGGFLQLHAAGLVMDNRGLLLVGPSGSGKTTLALSLLLKGLPCLSDEILLIEPSLCKVWPFPRSFHAHAETLRLFPGLIPGDSGTDFRDRSGKRRFDPVIIRKDWLAAPSEPAWLVFPTYSPNGQNNLIPLGETEALTLLLDQTINLITYGNAGLEVLIQLVRTCERYRLIARDIHCASSLLLNMAAHSHEIKKEHNSLRVSRYASADKKEVMMNAG